MYESPETVRLKPDTTHESPKTVRLKPDTTYESSEAVRREPDTTYGGEPDITKVYKRYVVCRITDASAGKKASWLSAMFDTARRPVRRRRRPA